MKRFAQNTIPFALAALSVMAFGSCSYEEAVVDPRGDHHNITLDIRIPGFDRPVTRGIEDGKGEAVVETIDVLIFDKSAHPLLLESHAGTNIKQTVSGTDYLVAFSVDVQVSVPDAGSVVVVANASTEVASAMSSAATNKKADILSALKFATQPVNGRYEWNVSKVNYKPIPMYGEAAVDGLAPGKKISGLELCRMLARIDVENEVDGSIFRLQEIYVVNHRTGGYIAPAWNATNGSLLKEGDAGYPYSGNENPMIPPDAGKPAATQTAALRYAYAQAGDAPGVALLGSIYTYESAKSDPADRENGTCLILKGLYHGAEYYYRVDFTADNGGSSGAHDVENMPLYRNHLYTVKITAAEGIGYTTFNDALRSNTVLSNLKTSLLGVDLTGINDIVFDGQYFMGNEGRIIDAVWGVDRSLKFRIVSDYAGDWKARVISSSDWLHLSGGQPTSQGTDINTTGLEIVLDAVGSPWDGTEYKSGQIVVTAGRLSDTITVRRVPVSHLMARSNIIMQGSGSSAKLTFAVTRDDNDNGMEAWSQGVLFKWGSLVAVGPAGNPYNPAPHVIYNPTASDPAGWGTGIMGWDNIPYAHDAKFGFVTPTGSGDDFDAFRTFNDGKGFNGPAGFGDICRYISAQPGWVEGKWRMPTYKEFLLLVEESPVTTASIGTFTNVTASLIENTHKYGKFNPLSGWFAGSSVNASTPGAANMKTPPDNVVFLPASGQRYPNGNGNSANAGAYGYYWSSTPYTTYSVNYFFTSRNAMDSNDADRSYAFPVRCIREY